MLAPPRVVYQSGMDKVPTLLCLEVLGAGRPVRNADHGKRILEDVPGGIKGSDIACGSPNRDAGLARI